MRSYGERLEMKVDEIGRPVSFWWRGRRYRVNQHLDRWQARTSWWRQGADVRAMELPVWRVEASTGERRGIFELMGQVSSWTLVSVQD